MLDARELTDLRWAILDSLIPEPPRRRDRRGRPWNSRRSVLNGILWVLRTGAPWADLPERYPSYQTCHRRFQQWILRVSASLSFTAVSVVTLVSHQFRIIALWEKFMPGGLSVRANWRNV
jgi:Putative transposase of IS4/5 family (DUF4096)